MSIKDRFIRVTARHRIAAVAGVLVVGLGAGLSVAPGASSNSAPVSGYIPTVDHVFVINIENKGYNTTWGPGSAAVHLNNDLRPQGVLLNAYYGTAHNSEPNYIAQVSGQGPNADMQGDCQIYGDFIQTATATPGQAVGAGCIFPKGTPSVMSQLDAANLSWRGYMDGTNTACVHPAPNTPDGTQTASATNDYATRHNPFMYFHDVIDNAAYCQSHVVPFTQLQTDLQSVSTTANLTYITPDLCHDGHDSSDPTYTGPPPAPACGLVGADNFVYAAVQQILASPAYQKDGMIVITADESDGPQTDASACCGEGPGPNSPLPGIVAATDGTSGGGLIGALVLSKWTKGNSWSTTPYNHYALLATLEEIFGLTKIGYAQTGGLDRFGLDVFNNGWQGTHHP